jgi:hypothetical protein
MEELGEDRPDLFFELNDALDRLAEQQAWLHRELARPSD